jgi:hypothetical protein
MKSFYDIMITYKIYIMPNYVQKLRTITTQNRNGFAESLKKQVSNKPVEYEDPRKGMSVEEVSRAYHTLQLMYNK